MSHDYGLFCSVVIRQLFGRSAQLVANCLFETNSRTFAQIAKVTKLPLSELQSTLATLLKFQLVSFTASANASTAEFSLKKSDVMHIFRFSRYINHVRGLLGNEAAQIIEELTYGGSQTATQLMLSCLKIEEVKDKIQVLQETLNTLIGSNYVISIAAPKQRISDANFVPEDVPKLHLEPLDAFKLPALNLPLIIKINEGACKIEDANDNTHWHINFNRFHQDFRDELLLNAISRKMGESTAECFKFILQKMYERTHPWTRDASNPFTFAEIRQAVEKKCKNSPILKHLDQHIDIIVQDSTGFLRRCGDMGGGQYVVDLTHSFEEIALAGIEHIITERFGSKASRIFRVVRHKKFIEQDALQKEAMVPAKEAKYLAYQLFQEQFFQIKTVRSSGIGGGGPVRTYFLFNLKLPQIAKMLLDFCFKTVYNIMTLSDYEQSENAGLIYKSQKLDTIVEIMKERGATEDYVLELMETITPPERDILNKVKVRLNTLSKAEVRCDETIFMLQMYLYHAGHAPSLTEQEL